MFKKKPERPSARTRQPNGTLNETFRRNNVVISKRQKEIAARQQSVTQRQADLKKSVARKRQKNRFIIFGVLAIAATLLYRMQLTSVVVESNASSKLTSVQKKQYEIDIQQQYNSSTLFGQGWLLDSEELGKKVMAQHPEIERVQFSSSAPLHTALKADVRFRKAIFTWKDASNVQQFVDAQGVLFAKNLEPSVSINELIKIEDQSGVVLNEGTSVLTDTIVSFIGQLPGKLTPVYGTDSSVAKVIIPRSTREVQVQMTNVPYVIKFNSTRDLNEQVGELQSLLGFLKGGNVTPGAYIDLRVAHKAFYK